MFCGATFLYMALLMEETNFDRTTVPVAFCAPLTALTPSSSAQMTGPSTSSRGKVTGISHTVQVDFSTSECGHPSMRPCRTKSVVQKLFVSGKPRPQRILYRVMLDLRLVTWPNIFYAGFSYGSYLIWFNVFNATASVILSGSPYNFSTGHVGLSYIANLVGVVGGAFFTGYLCEFLTVSLLRRYRD